MKMFHIVLLLYYIILLLQCVKTDHCSNYLEQLLENKCSSIPVNSSHICTYSNGKCNYKYISCESYQGKEQSICESIIPNEIGYKCQLDENEKCIKVEKFCNEYASQKVNSNSCSKIKTSDDTKRICVESPSGLGCKEQYKTCDLYNENEVSKNKNDCESIIIYSDSIESFNEFKKCSFTGNTCAEKQKDCSEITNELECSFAPFIYTLPENKTCIYKNKKCQEVYKTCELYDENVNIDSKNKEECESIYEERDASSYNCIFYPNNKTCSSVRKKCSDIKHINNCIYHIPTNENKRCVFVDNKCVEHFKTCELYDKETVKEKKTCEDIVPLNDKVYRDERSIDKHYKCVFNEKENQCLKKKVGCSEIKVDWECKYYEPEDTSKKCVYNFGECKEVFKSCSSYNDVPNKNSEDCKKINVYGTSNYIDYTKKCIYENDECKEKTLYECDDYDPALEERYCRNIYLNSYKGCTLKENKCVEYYKDCPEEKIDEKTCNSIIPYNLYSKCILNENKICISVKKKCSEYRGNSKSDCIQCEPVDNKKRCFWENEVCIEKYIYCEDYTGKDSKECESIIPYDENGKSLYNTHKCNLVGDKCSQVQKKCNDAKNSYECEEITTSNENTKCFYKNNQCFEQYKDCESYNLKLEKRSKEECESIPTDSSLTKCKFTDNICKQEEIKCPDYEIDMDSFKSSCEEYSPSVDIKCSFSNSVCTESRKSCKELENQAGVTEDICSLASTSQKNKRCTLNVNNGGCQEIDSTDQDSNKNTEKSENSSGVYLNSLLFIIFFII